MGKKIGGIDEVGEVRQHGALLFGGVIEGCLGKEV